MLPCEFCEGSITYLRVVQIVQGNGALPYEWMDEWMDTRFENVCELPVEQFFRFSSIAFTLQQITSRML